MATAMVEDPQGPAVSTDQFVVRTTLVALAGVGAVGLRLYAWRGRGRT